MSDLYKNAFRGYLIDHHSPNAPVAPLDKLSDKELKKFLKEANVNSLMVYFKDHWGNSYYDTKIGKKHNGLKIDWIAQVAAVLKELKIEFNAYYCFEYDSYAPKAHPEWSTLKEDGTPLRCGDKSYHSIARWGMPCYETEYRQYILGQLKEMIINYKPDSLFIDIFGKSLCYCNNCKKKFKEQYNYNLPETDEEVVVHSKDVLEFLNKCAESMLDDVKAEIKEINPSIAITINFAAHYPKEIRDKLDYVFTEPWAGNWLSGAYARDTSKGKYPQLGPGDVSSIYNYLPESIYEMAAADIAAQGCRVFIYSESMRPDGSLEFEEAKRIGKAFTEVEKYEEYLTDRNIIADIGIIQSDAEEKIKSHSKITPNAIGRAKEGSPHRDALLGAMKLCDYSKYTWNILPETEATIDVLINYKLIILPNMYYISNELKEMITSYVNNGGVVLTGDETGLYDENGNMLENYTISDLIGCNFSGTDYGYTSNVWSHFVKPIEDEVWKYVPKTTPPVSEYIINIESKALKILGTFVEPAVKLSDTEWVNWGYPPPKNTTTKPALIENDYGKGKVIYAAFDIFRMENKNFNWIKELFNGILEKHIIPSIYLKTDYPSIVGFTSYKRSNGEIIIHEVSHCSTKFSGDAPYINGGILKINKTTFNIISVMCVYPDNTKLSYTEDDIFYYIDLPDIRVHNMFRLKLGV